MKKVIFMALAAVFVLSSGFDNVASNTASESEEYSRYCVHTITRYWIDNNGLPQAETQTFYTSIPDNVQFTGLYCTYAGGNIIMDLISGDRQW